MMMTKIVADSSADLLTLGDLPFASVPLTIHAGDRVFVDDEHCDIDGMIAFLRTYKGKTTTSCPNTECWLKAFGDADTVYCVTISSAMSGTYNAAMLAAKEYMELHPERRVLHTNGGEGGGLRSQGLVLRGHSCRCDRLP